MSRQSTEDFQGSEIFRGVLYHNEGFPGDSVVKNLLIVAGDIRDVVSIPGSGRSAGGGHGNPLQYSCLENPHGQRGPAGYRPWSGKESDMTEAT